MCRTRCCTAPRRLPASFWPVLLLAACFCLVWLAEPALAENPAVEDSISIHPDRAKPTPLPYACFTPDNRYLVAGYGREIEVWDMATRRLLRVLRSDYGTLCLVAAGEDSGVVTGVFLSDDPDWDKVSYFGLVMQWDIRDGSLLATYPFEYETGFSPDPQYTRLYDISPDAGMFSLGKHVFVRQDDQYSEIHVDSEYITYIDFCNWNDRAIIVRDPEYSPESSNDAPPRGPTTITFFDMKSNTSIFEFNVLDHAPEVDRISSVYHFSSSQAVVVTFITKSLDRAFITFNPETFAITPPCPLTEESTCHGGAYAFDATSFIWQTNRMHSTECSSSPFLPQYSELFPGDGFFDYLSRFCPNLMISPDSSMGYQSICYIGEYCPAGREIIVEFSDTISAEYLGHELINTMALERFPTHEGLLLGGYQGVLAEIDLRNVSADILFQSAINMEELATTGISIAQDGSAIASCTSQGGIYILDTFNNSFIDAFEYWPLCIGEDFFPSASPALNPDGTVLAFLDNEGIHVRHDTDAITLLVPGVYTKRIHFSNNGSYLYYTRYSDNQSTINAGALCRFHIPSMTEDILVDGLVPENDYGRTLPGDFSTNGRYALYRDSDGLIYVHDLETLVRTEIQGTRHRRGWWPRTVSDDGSIAVVQADAQLDILRVPDGSLINSLPVRGELMAIDPDNRLIEVVSDEGALSIWDIESGELLATVYLFADTEWIFITPEGYYSSSPRGHQRITARVGDTLQGMDQFYDVFYRPDIVRAKLQGEDIAPLASLTIEDALQSPPPVVKIDALPGTADGFSLDVPFVIDSAGGGIGEIRVFVNGKLVQSDGYYRPLEHEQYEELASLESMNGRALLEQNRAFEVVLAEDAGSASGPDRGDTYEDTVTVELVPGENTISVCAFNRHNTVQSMMATHTVTCTAEPEEPHLYILSVGVNDYQSDENDLVYAAKDAQDMLESLENAAASLFDEQNIHNAILLDIVATRDNILAAFDDVASQAQPGDAFVLFLAGHGILVGDQYSFVTHDFAGSLTDSCLITSAELVEASKAISAQSQLMIMDTCHAGGVDYLVSGLYDARISTLARQLGLHVYASCSSTEEALDGYEDNGLFTHALLEGLLNPEADSDDNGRVGAIELGDFAQGRTVDISGELGFEQRPVIVNFGEDMELYSLP